MLSSLATFSFTTHLQFCMCMCFLLFWFTPEAFRTMASVVVEGLQSLCYSWFSLLCFTCFCMLFVFHQWLLGQWYRLWSMGCDRYVIPCLTLCHWFWSMGWSDLLLCYCIVLFLLSALSNFVSHFSVSGVECFELAQLDER